MQIKLPYKIALAIISYNRPEYLIRCLKSLEKQTDLDVDIFFFQDGVVNFIDGRTMTQKERVDQCIALWRKANLPKTGENIRPQNVGIAINQLESHNYLFFEKNYRAIVIVEDDLVFSTNWVRITKLMLKQWQDDPLIATVQASVEARQNLTLEEKQRLYNRVYVGMPHWWGTAIWKEKWERIWPIYKQYFDMIVKYNYQIRDHNAIRQWYKDTWHIPEDITSQDRAKEWSTKMAGMARIYTVVNRAKYIGEYGVHSNPQCFADAGYANMTIDDLVEDDNISEFIAYDTLRAQQYINECLQGKKLTHGF